MFNRAERCKRLIQDIQEKEHQLERLKHEQTLLKKEIKSLNNKWKSCMEDNQLDLF